MKRRRQIRVSKKIIPQLLDQLVETPGIAETCRVLDISTKTHHAWHVQSVRGEPKLQRVRWHGVIAPYHVHVENAKILAMNEAEGNAIARVKDGYTSDVFFQGVRMTERVRNPKYKGWTDVDVELMGEPADYWLTVPTKQHNKPSDQLTLGMLAPWKPKYRKQADVQVNIGGVLRLVRPEDYAKQPQQVTDVSFEEVERAQETGNKLAIAHTAKTEAERAQRQAAGEFDHTPVAFVDANGKRVEIQAARDPLAPRPDDSPLVRDLKARAAAGPRNPIPLDKNGHRTIPNIKGMTADDLVPDRVTGAATKETRASARPAQQPGTGREGLGYGRAAPGGYKP